MLPYPEIDPVAVAIGPLKVHWYGLAYLAGLLFAGWLAARRAAAPGAVLKRAQVEDMIFYSALGVVLGGRLGYIFFYGLGRLVEDPLWALRVWEGGMSFHGGMLGVILANWFYARSIGVNYADLLDFVAPLVPVGLGLGRLGNFIGQELWGRATSPDFPLAMIFPRDPLALPRHPSQLYQATLEGLILFLLLYFYSRKPRPRLAVGGVFMLGYGCARFAVEFAREPDAHLSNLLFGWMTRGQLLCLPMIAFGLFLLYNAYGARRNVFGERQPA
ncbi:MAG: prolipoprotein diacylglyceryl transferase [Pseudomonadota bacterium]